LDCTGKLDSSGGLACIGLDCTGVVGLDNANVLHCIGVGGLDFTGIVGLNNPAGLNCTVVGGFGNTGGLYCIIRLGCDRLV